MSCILISFWPIDEARGELDDVMMIEQNWNRLPECESHNDHNNGRMNERMMNE